MGYTRHDLADAAVDELLVLSALLRILAGFSAESVRSLKQTKWWRLKTLVGLEVGFETYV